jgi:hypothetical protein
MVVTTKWKLVTRNSRRKLKMTEGIENGGDMSTAMVNDNPPDPSPEESVTPSIPTTNANVKTLRLELAATAGKTDEQNHEMIMKSVNVIMGKMMQFIPNMKLNSIDNSSSMLEFNPIENDDEFKKYFTVLLSESHGKNNPHTIIFNVERDTYNVVTDILKVNEIRKVFERERAFIKEHNLPIGRIDFIGSIYAVPVASINIKSFESEYNANLKNYLKDKEKNGGKYESRTYNEEENLVEFSTRFTTVEVEQYGETNMLQFHLIDVRCEKIKKRWIIDLLFDSDLPKEKFGLFGHYKVRFEPLFKDLVVHHNTVINEHSRVIISNWSEELLTTPAFNTTSEGEEEHIVPMEWLKEAENENGDQVVTSIIKMGGFKDRWIVNTTKSEIGTVTEIVLEMIKEVMKTEAYINKYGRNGSPESHLQQPAIDEANHLTKIASSIPQSIITTSARQKNSNSSSSDGNGRNTWAQVASNNSGGSPNSSVSNSSLESQISILQEGYKKLTETISQLKGDLEKANASVQDLTSVLNRRDEQIEKMTNLVNEQMVFIQKRDAKHKQEVSTIFQQIANKGHMVPENESTNGNEKRNRDKISETPADQTPSYTAPPAKQHFQQGIHEHQQHHLQNIQFYHQNQQFQHQNQPFQNQMYMPPYGPTFQPEFNQFPYYNNYDNEAMTNNFVPNNSSTPVPYAPAVYQQNPQYTNMNLTPSTTTENASLEKTLDDEYFKALKKTNQDDSLESKTPLRGGSARKFNESELILDNSNVSVPEDIEGNTDQHSEDHPDNPPDYSGKRL